MERRLQGGFCSGNHRRCYPLTISDNATRYLFQCRGLERTHHGAVQPWFEWVFREYGLPEAIRTDNGAPFASLALGGLSRLSVWWIRLGITPQRIKPGKPSQNGRHERMHKSLEAEGVAPIQATLAGQQRQLDRFAQDYNWHRSHEALGRKTPGSVYQPSPRPYPARVPPVDYDAGTTVRQVRHNGEIKWRGELLYVSHILAKEPVAMEPIDEHHWAVRYSFYALGLLDERPLKIKPHHGWHGAKS